MASKWNHLNFILKSLIRRHFLGAFTTRSCGQLPKVPVLQVSMNYRIIRSIIKSKRASEIVTTNDSSQLTGRFKLVFY
jgi:hypothetical protein